MLQLKKITKDYRIGDTTIQALKGVSLKFRKNEFVSILGPSGCGKTTMLNILGGLDRYTSGDLIINGKSTKEFKESDWDTYRNHSIGFVFQSYNLIPHQSVLSNVELALTLSGVSKAERRHKAEEALRKVGLEKHIHKNPSQLSGGQMQRVAIARALVNDPDILLADEPTGALDSETSLQIMELLREIAVDRLIIMVTHNRELAREYSTRIIRLLDGEVTDDSNPFDGREKKGQGKKKGQGEKTAMSFSTALSLSLNNLLTKKTRTFMTAFAGSIGIIGIALILALSNGFQGYIDKIQADTLSNYPLVIDQTAIDLSMMMESVMGNNTKEEGADEGKVHANNILGDSLASMTENTRQNDLAAFRTYLEKNREKIEPHINAISYGYDVDLNMYNPDTSERIVQLSPFNYLNIPGTGSMGAMSSMGGMMGGAGGLWTEMLDNRELLESQYDVLAGEWPGEYDEIAVVVDENNQLTDYALYALGMKDITELEDLLDAVATGGTAKETESLDFALEDILAIRFKLVLNTDYYVKEGGIWTDKRGDEEYMRELLETAPEIRVTAVLRPAEESTASSIGGTIGYRRDLTNYIINGINNAEIVQEQIREPEKDVFSGQTFDAFQGDEGGEMDFSGLTLEEQAYLASLTEEEQAALLESSASERDITFEANLERLGVVDVEIPSSINLYPRDFQAKEALADIIDEYNREKRSAGDEDLVIRYTDITGMMISGISTIINAITYVLIAFVAISLVVSSIMIGIITYISVLERKKEIGILRSIGARSKDISRVFNAETLIVGFVSGALGILIALLLTVPINWLIASFIAVTGLSRLPFWGGVTLILISMFLSLIAGLIPAGIAARKDPVDALRSE